MTFDILKLLAGTRVEARPYQQRIISRVVSSYAPVEDGGKALRSIMINSATGSGKTVMALLTNLAMQQQHDCLAGWISMRRNLLIQAASENSPCSPTNPRGKNIGAKIEFISMFEKNIPQHLLPENRNGRKLIITVDEAQHDAANSCAHLHAILKPDYILGLSATPFRADCVKLCFDTVINDAGIGALIKEGYLSQYEHFTIPSWSVKDATWFYLREPDKWGKSIFYFHTIKQCEEATEILRAGGTKVELVTGDSKREPQLERFRSGEVDVIVNCMVLTEGFDCLSEDTEILTPKGWVGKDDVKEGDMCYSLNRETCEMEITQIDAHDERPLHPGERMISVKSQHLDLLTTEGHEFHIKYRDPGKIGNREQRLSDNFITLTGADLLERKSEFQLPLAAQMEFEGLSISDDELRLIAWSQTDGYLTPSGALEISQSEKDSKHANHIRQLLNKLGVTYSEGRRKANRDGTGHGFKSDHDLIRFYVYAESISNLVPFMDKRDLSNLNNMSRRQFKLFWDELLLGNGSKSRPNSSGWLWLPHKEQADALQAMAIVRGFACNQAPFITEDGVTVWRVSARDVRWMGIRPTDQRAAKITATTEYTGLVWCVRNKNATIVVRRNGKVAIIGNCPNLKTVFLRPSCKGVTIQMAGRAFRCCPEIPLKRVVQCEKTKWPFMKTADPACAYRWDPPTAQKPGQWLSLKPNKHINDMNCKMLATLAGINLPLPKYMADKKAGLRQKKKRF